jgi:hypothetical protein
VSPVSNPSAKSSGWIQRCEKTSASSSTSGGGVVITDADLVGEAAGDQTEQRKDEQSP